MFREQAGLCQVCNLKLGEDVVVDHCHDTGKVRGLLHNGCNLALGMLGDDVDNLYRGMLYLKKHAANTTVGWL